MYVDPSGHFAISGLLLGLGALFALTAGSILSYNTNSNTEIARAIENTMNDFADGVFSTIDSVVSDVKDRIETKMKHWGIMASLASIIVKKIYPNNARDYHHIVAKSSWKAIPAQKILAKYGISLEDERNKVYVKRGIHRVLHTNFYYMSVNTSVALGSLLGGEEGVLAVLKIYKAFLGGL